METFIVGITGVMDTGKTRLSNVLEELIPKSAVIHIDDVVMPFAGKLMLGNEQAIAEAIKSINEEVNKAKASGSTTILLEGTELALYVEGGGHLDTVVFTRADNEETRFKHSKSAKHYSDFYEDVPPFALFMQKSQMQVGRIISTTPKSDYTVVNYYDETFRDEANKLATFLQKQKEIKEKGIDER